MRSDKERERQGEDSSDALAKKCSEIHLCALLSLC
jgi:hypothetical protein